MGSSLESESRTKIFPLVRPADEKRALKVGYRVRAIFEK
jgi:hypothetical protein